ncbi:FAD-binding oxidoreductase [Bosea caraganae]|uniref:FAD-binding oxidoreductase n=1 Tax=Bosea caraganae TaxID=2763117 RepID=A0A370KYN6_9HYPH|nr:FAD-binding oxidoreductase [Bosea caraganae]RDJ20101.1 FAD-binding oxidoreductase [Bosea caraganae]RDJ24813.1 FAD-binding oxidoreductase [Bosea caraganae]
MSGHDDSTSYDLAVIGGGIMGSAAAIQAAEGGMQTVLIEKSELGSGASGVNAGTLSLQIKRVRLMPYAIRGHALWEHAGDRVGFRRTGGLTLAFTEPEAERLTTTMAMKKEAGAPIVMKSPAEVAALEPGLNKQVVLASYCAEDGYANSSLTGVYYRGLLAGAGVRVHERLAVDGIARSNGAFILITAAGPIRAKRILIACGGWMKDVAAMLGVDLPIRVRINTVAVTERCPPVVGSVIGHATGLLTLKQKTNGTILIGGGWQGRGTPKDGRGEVVAESLLTNLRLAQFAVPALGSSRIARVWTGFEPNVPDFYPLAGALPGVPDAFILGCVRGGYTIGPYIGRLMGDLILGREPEMPLFDPARFAPAKAQAAATH